jgi:alpha-tubulin suppressor-like RCC1 family protein
MSRVVIAVTIAFAGASSGYAATRERAVAETVLHNSNERLSVGGSHACEIQGDGTVRCWGNNNAGQLGDGTTTSRLTPVTVPGFNGALAVAAGQSHTCAIFGNGRVYCWGDNSLGQLGDGTHVRQLTPVAALTGTNVAVAITAGAYHTCVLTVDGRVGCWGNNSSGQLGDGSFTNQATPVFRLATPGLVAISAGSSHTCALTTHGQVVCWGENSSGQIGDGTTINRPTLALVGGGTLQTVVAIAAGNFHTCAILVDGTARCWGENGGGQLGDRTFQNRPLPVAVNGLTNAVAMTGSSYHTCALLSDGGARCWGLNSTGELGDGTNTDRRTPVAVSGLDRAVAIDSGTVSDLTGFSQTCAMRADGTTRCWGSNGSGQLGNGTTSDRATPGVVTGLAGSVTAREIAAGANHTCAVRADSTVACWGGNGSGQLGDGGNTSKNAPSRVPGLDGVVALAAGSAHTCALLADGTVRCWGAGASGQLGDGGTSNRSSPVTVGGLTNAVAIAAGSFHTCAARVDGTVRCWGANAKGQIGDGSRTNRPTPTVVSGATLTVALAAGGEHTCMLNVVGIGTCWGAGASGQTGDGFTFDHLTPGAGVIADAVGIAAGDLHGCAVRADGGASCWGANANGQLGFATLFEVPSLTAGSVNTLPATTSRIAAGAFHTCTVQADSTARCWGDNSKGQIGDGTTTSKFTPTTVSVAVVRNLVTGGTVTIVSPISGVIQIVTGGHHTCALNASGSVRCWGDNTLGQLGDASNTDRLRPVTVPSFILNIDPSVSLVEGLDREATVTILASCEVGERLHVDVELVQGEVSGRAVGTGDCTGALERYPVTVHLQGAEPFLEGPAEVRAVADIRESGFVDHQEWTRRVTILGEN